MQTIKQVADANNVSKTTIRRYLKKLQLDIVVNDNGISLVDDDVANVISDMIQHNRAEQMHRNSATDAETPEQVNQNSGTVKNLQYQNIPEHSGTCTETVEHMNRNSGTYVPEQVINAKNEQIEQMQKQIDFLQNQVTELTTALKASQSIQALYVQRIEQQEQQPERKGLFARLFKR